MERRNNMPDDDSLTLTVRLHDPTEKQDATKSTAWVVMTIPRADLALSAEEFSAKWMTPSASHVLASLKR